MIAYLAGPINGCTDDEATTWREQVKAQLGEEACLDPMRRDYRGREDDSVNNIVDGDLSDIHNSTVIIANCWAPSTGTAMELWYAAAGKWRGGGDFTPKPIVAIVPPGKSVSPWLRYVAREIVTSVDAAVFAAIRLG